MKPIPKKIKKGHQSQPLLHHVYIYIHTYTYIYIYTSIYIHSFPTFSKISKTSILRSKFPKKTLWKLRVFAALEASIRGRARAHPRRKQRSAPWRFRGSTGDGKWRKTRRKTTREDRKMGRWWWFTWETDSLCIYTYIIHACMYLCIYNVHRCPWYGFFIYRKRLFPGKIERYHLHIQSGQIVTWNWISNGLFWVLQAPKRIRKCQPYRLGYLQSQLASTERKCGNVVL